jgi:hypothetical protein
MVYKVEELKGLMIVEGYIKPFNLSNHLNRLNPFLRVRSSSPFGVDLLIKRGHKSACFLELV